MKFTDLLVKHDYYCSDNSYYKLDFNTTYPTFQHFYNEMGDADTDMNLVFRFDIKERDIEDKKDDQSKYYMEIFLVHQRKGRFVPMFIEDVFESDFDLIQKYLSKRYLKIKQLWTPFTDC